MLIGGRVIASVGASGLINGALTILAASLPLEKRPLPTAIVMGISQLGVALGSVIGGAFTPGSLGAGFYINLPIGALVTLPLILVRIPERIPKEKASSVLREIHHKLDLVGFVIFAPAVIMLLLALQYGGNDFAWNSSQDYDTLLPIPIIKRREIWARGMNYTLVMSALFGASYFLPIYFQAVKGVEALTSGDYLLAMILPQMLLVVVAGATVNGFGYIPPFLIISGALTAVGTCLFSLFQPDTSTGKWVGFLVITGLGRGLGIMMPIIATQNVTTEDEVSSATAFIVWAQYIGPTTFLSIYNVIFDSVLRSELRLQAPNVNPKAVIAAGATHFRRIVDPRDLHGVLVAYSNSIAHVFYLAAALATVASPTEWGMSWKRIIKSKMEETEPTELSDTTASLALHKLSAARTAMRHATLDLTRIPSTSSLSIWMVGEKSGEQLFEELKDSPQPLLISSGNTGWSKNAGERFVSCGPFYPLTLNIFTFPRPVRSEQGMNIGHLVGNTLGITQLHRVEANGRSLTSEMVRLDSGFWSRVMATFVPPSLTFA